MAGQAYADHARGNIELQAILRDIFKTKTIGEWIAFADEHNTTIAPVNTPKTVVDDPQFQDRFTWIDARSRRGADQLLFPLHVEGEELPIPTKAPTVGEHTDEVLRPRARLRRRQARQAPRHRRARIALTAARAR